MLYHLYVTLNVQVRQQGIHSWEKILFNFFLFKASLYCAAVDPCSITLSCLLLTPTFYPTLTVSLSLSPFLDIPRSDDSVDAGKTIIPTTYCIRCVCESSSAIDQKTKEKVAIKKLYRPFQSLIHAKRAYRELRLLRHIQHDNVSHI